MKKVKLEDLGLKTAGLPEEQQKFIDGLLGRVVDVINKASEGDMSKEDVEAKFKSINDQLGKLDENEYIKQLKKDNEDMCAQVKNLAESIDKLKKKGIDVNGNSKFDEAFDEMYNSQKFQDFLGGVEKSAKGFSFQMKDVSWTANSKPGGTILDTQQQNRVVSQATNKGLHIRNIVTCLSGDPEYPMLAWQQIYDLDRTARYVSENGMLPETSFKVKEATSEVKRLGNYIKISRRMLKSKPYVRSVILNMLPEGVRQAEDFGVLFGDGSGDNLKGITTYEGVLPVEKIVNDVIIKGDAGAVTAVKQAENGIIVTLAKPHDLLVDGMKITFKAATTNTAMNATFDVIKLSDTELFLEGAAYAGDESTTVNKITFTVNNAGFKSVESPNSVDALETAIAVMTYAQFRPTAIVINPITLNSIRTEKDTTGNRLKLVEGFNGNVTIGGLPVILYTGIPAGKYFLGDFTNGANIVDYTTLSLDWADDVDTKLKNQVVLYAQEELILPVYNPWAFAYGSISALKTAITKG